MQGAPLSKPTLVLVKFPRLCFYLMVAWWFLIVWHSKMCFYQILSELLTGNHWDIDIVIKWIVHSLVRHDHYDIYSDAFGPFDIITFPRPWASPLTWTYTCDLHDAMEIQTLVKLIGGVWLAWYRWSYCWRYLIVTYRMKIWATTSFGKILLVWELIPGWLAIQWGENTSSLLLINNP